MCPRLILFMLIFSPLLLSATTHAETIRISSETTSSPDLPKVIAQALQRLAKVPGQGHELLLEGRFKLSASIRIHWWMDQPLRVEPVNDAEVVLDGAALPKGKETVFLAGRNISFKGIRFVNSQGHAVVVGGKSHHYKVSHCVFEDCRQGGIHVWNDPHTVVTEMTPRGWITNNHIARFNLDDAKWKNDGITVFDQRVIIADNDITESPTQTNAIRVMGRDIVVERNRITDVSRDDSGGIYLWGGPHASVFRGNIIRHNYVKGAARGIYLDDGTSGARVYENVVHQSTVCGLFVSGGRDNTLRRNLVDQAPVFFHLDSRCLGWDSRPDFSSQVRESLSRLKTVLNDEAMGEVFRKRYVGLRTMDADKLTTETYGRPKGNRVLGNYVHGVHQDWELMDFSRRLSTEFLKLNDLRTPSPWNGPKDLSKINYKQQFGFEENIRIQVHGNSPSHN
jgi:parallel beta-helix repeat protein